MRVEKRAPPVRVRGLSPENPLLMAFILLWLTLLIIFPIRFGGIDIALLALFRAASQQNNEEVSVFTKIDAVSRAKIDPIFLDPFAHALAIREIAGCHALKTAAYIDVLSNLNCQ